tara:strand:+ start:52 stop:732 length:681 start_codon:yes stop_codon:yes gene_type:complete
MENKNHIIEHNMRYLNNGKVAQNYKIKLTPIKSTKVKNINATNGKLFTQELFVALKKNNIKKSSINKNESANVTSWLLNTLNPINHLPIISTINNMVNKTSKSLDIVQSAIGGAIYGGGPMGLAKGIGGWFLNKLIPTNKVAIKPKSIKESNITNPTPKENNKLIKSSGDSENFIKTSKPKIEDRKEQPHAPNSISVVKKKSINHNFYYYHSIEQKQKRNIIDTDA